ncbi:MAG: DUF5666 domain-containing protein [Bifidobacteriaceae bacterium]|jgi:hypothetical protein|nr:DUF5666 domain-containing protein [Bifidobacteriaceae bacterium]
MSNPVSPDNANPPNNQPLDVLAAAPSSIPPLGGQKKRPVLTWVLAGVVAVGAVFGGGFGVGRATAPDPGRGGFLQRAQTGGMGQAMRAGAVRGEVTAVDGDSLTVKNEDGTESTVTLTDSTSVLHIDTGEAGDLQPGDTVTVMGTPGEDGSSGLTALSITEGDVAGGGFAAFGGPPAGGGGGFTSGGGFPGGGEFPDGGGFPDGGAPPADGVPPAGASG